MVSQTLDLLHIGVIRGCLVIGGDWLNFAFILTANETDPGIHDLIETSKMISYSLGRTRKGKKILDEIF